jgi:hypothetical protein
MTALDQKACSVSDRDCNGPAKARGLCLRHYKRLMSRGSTQVSRPCLHLPTEEKFWRYAVRGENADACWKWSGFRDKDGYGKMRVGGTNIAAHRISWQIHNGASPGELLVLHRCNNPGCSNPSHLRLGDHDENMRDRSKSGNYGVNESASAVKYSDDVVRGIRLAAGTYRAISERFGVSISQVANIKAGRQRPDACHYLKAAEMSVSMPSLFDALEVEAAEVMA